MQLQRLHNVTMAPNAASHSVRQEGESRQQFRARHTGINGSDVCPKANSTPERERRAPAIPTIPEVTETPEKKTRFRSRNVMSLVSFLCCSDYYFLLFYAQCTWQTIRILLRILYCSVCVCHVYVMLVIYIYLSSYCMFSTFFWPLPALCASLKQLLYVLMRRTLNRQH